VEGRLQTRSYEQDGQKKYFTEVICDELILLGSRGSGDSQGPPADYERPVSMPRSAQPRPQPAATAAPVEEFNQGITDDDVPF